MLLLSLISLSTPRLLHEKFSNAMVSDISIILHTWSMALFIRVFINLVGFIWRKHLAHSTSMRCKKTFLKQAKPCLRTEKKINWFGLYNLVFLWAYLEKRKVTSARKSFFFFYHIIATNIYWMNNLIWRKNKVSLSRYFNFWVFDESTNIKICGNIVDIIIAH